jgi:coenzyme F420-0:L-glutamate ligase/coenzyme F420-1:gamma-L-glutamate ligase
MTGATPMLGLQVWPLAGVPMVAPGSDLCGLIEGALEASEFDLCDGDVLVLAQKIVSKAERRSVDLRSVTPTEPAIELADRADKDPRLVQLILQESTEVLRVRPGLIVVQHRLGFVAANAGIDHSNVGPGGEQVLLLPEDPDATCAKLSSELQARLGVDVAVLINDSFGRAWRIGTIGTAIGVAGLTAVADLRGRPDLFGVPLLSTVIGFADQVASAASLVQGEADEGAPIAVVRGLAHSLGAGTAADLQRPRDEDLFR